MFCWGGGALDTIRRFAIAGDGPKTKLCRVGHPNAGGPRTYDFEAVQMGSRADTTTAGKGRIDVSVLGGESRGEREEDR